MTSNAAAAGVRPSISSAVSVLIVDDSAVVRQLLTRELGRDSTLRIVGSAPDAYAARDMILAFQPDVMTLDVEMPRMDGITFLRKLMQHHPMPVIVLSSLTAEGTRLAVEALQAGAVEVMCKPTSVQTVAELGPILAAKIKAAALARARAEPLPATLRNRIEKPAANTSQPAVSVGSQRIIAIGASTGGVQALSQILTAFPTDAPAALIVQHMPEHFTASFATRLNASCNVEVREAVDGDPVLPGRVLIAPGGMHMVLRRSDTRYFVEVSQGPEVQHQRPSVDVLFHSVAKCAGTDAIGAILTGMGSDGAAGLLAMKDVGAMTIAQDEQTSVVYGMPMEAVRCGAARKVLPLNQIAAEMIRTARVT